MLSLNSASSLREPKVRGNLVILGLSLRESTPTHRHCESCLQLVAILFILGLSLRDFVEVVAIYKKLKIEAQSGKMISLLNHFSLSSHKVRNERSEDQNEKLKIKN